VRCSCHRAPQEARKAHRQVVIHASRSATRFEALEPIRQGVRHRFGRFDHQIAAGLAVRHDHGSQYVVHDFQEELAFLGIASSPSFVWAPEGNGCAEARPTYAALGHGSASPSGP
jgi:transposase InsO family protein